MTRLRQNARGCQRGCILLALRSEENFSGCGEHGSSASRLSDARTLAHKRSKTSAQLALVSVSTACPSPERRRGLAVPVRARAPKPNATQPVTGLVLGLGSGREIQGRGPDGGVGDGPSDPRERSRTYRGDDSSNVAAFFFCSSYGRTGRQDQTVNKCTRPVLLERLARLRADFPQQRDCIVANRLCSDPHASPTSEELPENQAIERA